MKIKPFPSQSDRLSHIRQRMEATGQWSDHQAAGRRWTIGCVSLEVTQRCNLDCTLCYLSESAEAIRDLPIEELFRRIDQIAEQYGPNTDVQISGGDPTLRDKDELSSIVRYIRVKGLRASLFTNGILLTRPWLERLIGDGLNDVAFHVDITQERKGFSSELSLNVIRKKYIELARGLPISVIFNTSIFNGNLHEVAALADFFTLHSDVVRFASFQLGADTGRGTTEARSGPDLNVVTQQSIMAAIQKGTGTKLNFDALHGGHRSCNRYAMLLTVGSKRIDGLADSRFVATIMRETASAPLERDQSLRGAFALIKAVLSRPSLWAGSARYVKRLAWQSRDQFFRDQRIIPQVRKISFFLHNFMDSCALEQERIDSCVFMAATADGPMSMCEYNAKRDSILLKPITLKNGEQWQPLALKPNSFGDVTFPAKWLKGRSRQQAQTVRANSKQNGNQQKTQSHG